MRNFLIFIILFFSKIFIVKCKTRKVRLYLFFRHSLYRYFSEKNDEYTNFKDTNDIEELNTDYEIKDNILDLKEIEEKIKSKQIIFKNKDGDFYDDNIKIDIKNYKITSLKLLSNTERKAFSYLSKGKSKRLLKPFDTLEENFYQYKIEDLNNKVKIPDSVNFVYICIEDFSKSDLFKNGTIKYLSLRDGDKSYCRRLTEEYMEIDTIKIDDLYKNLKYIEKYDYHGNSQLSQLLIDKLSNDDKYKNLKFNFFNLTKDGDEKLTIEDLKKMGVFVYEIILRGKNGLYVVKNEENSDNNDMKLTCYIKFKRKVKIIFNIPENTELDLGLGMQQEAEIEFYSFDQEFIEDGLTDAIRKIFTNKSRLNGKKSFILSNFWKGNEVIWPEKYEIENEKGKILYTIIGHNYESNFINIMNEDNLTFKIYLKPGSELLKGIHVKLHFKPVAGKFVSKELEKMPINTDIIYRTDMYGTVFLNKGENYIEQIKKILKEGYFNKQKISLDDDCYDLYLRDNKSTKEFIPLTDDNQLQDDSAIYIVFNNNAIGKYIKDKEDDSDPVYYGAGKNTDRDNTKFDPYYEYHHTYSYQPVTGNFENYYNIFSKKNEDVHIEKEDKPEDGIPEYGNPIQTPITTPEKIDNKVLENLGCCAKCLKCCCCCKPRV